MNLVIINKRSTKLFQIVIQCFDEIMKSNPFWSVYRRIKRFNITEYRKDID